MGTRHKVGLGAWSETAYVSWMTRFVRREYLPPQ